MRRPSAPSTMRSLSLLLAGFIVLVDLASPASAAEVREPVGRSQPGTLHLGEAERMVKELLRQHIGSAVASNSQPPTGVAVWGCRIDATEAGERGACFGSVTAGLVTCRGEFRVREYRGRDFRYYAWPVDLVCSMS